MIKNIKLAYVLCSVCLLNACGSGDSDSQPGENGNNNGNSETQTNYNGVLQGHLFIGDEGKYLDLATGEYRSLIPDDIDYHISPSSDGKEFVEKIGDYRNLPDSYLRNDAVFIRDMQTGLTVDSFEISETLYNPVKLSPDRRFIAAIWRDESSGEDIDEEKLTIFSRDGQIRSRSKEQDVSSFDWLPDGRLVYSEGQSIYITADPNVINSSALVTFTESQGWPTWIAVSPDGTKIVFELATGGGSPFIQWRDATLWTMDIDGSELSLFATSNAETPRVNAPAWSPDGNWVLAVEGHISGVGFSPDPFDPEAWLATPVGVTGALFAVPTNIKNTVLPADGSTSARPVFFVTDEGKAKYVRPGIFPHLKWISAVEDAPQIPGSLLEGGGINRGISGTIYINDDGEGDTTAVHALNIQSGIDDMLLTLTDDDLDNVSDILYASNDAQLFALYHSDARNPVINIFSRDGEKLQSLPLETDSYDIVPRSPIRFSPVDKDLILIQYKNYYSGDEYLNDYVVIANWKEKKFVKFYRSREYLAVDWAPDGSVILAGKNSGFYQSTYSAGGFSNTTLLFSFKDPGLDLTVSPDGSRLALYLVGQIWTCDLQGNNLKRLTAPAESFHALPEWSPDGKYIAFKAIDSDESSLKLGKIWIAAANAENIRIRDIDNTPNAIPLKNQAGKHVRIFGAYSWR